MSHDNGVPKSTICECLRDVAKDPQIDLAVFTRSVAGTLSRSPVLSIQAQKLPSDLHFDNPIDLGVSKGWLHCFQ